MRFEHLVEVNDPLNPLIDTLTLNQIWQGLVLRVREPDRPRRSIARLARLRDQRRPASLT